MRNTNPTRLKVIGSLVRRGQTALELAKTKTTIAEYLRLSNTLLEQDAPTIKGASCVWVENRSQNSEELYSPPNQ
jgi:hypothetical protein